MLSELGQAGLGEERPQMAGILQTIRASGRAVCVQSRNWRVCSQRPQSLSGRRSRPQSGLHLIA